MARYIDAEQAIHLIENDALLQVYYSKSDAIDCINATPTADVQEVRHGRWISNELGGYKWAYHCSECGWVDGYPFNDRHKYCPHCGAKMDGEREEGNDNG